MSEARALWPVRPKFENTGAQLSEHKKTTKHMQLVTKEKTYSVKFEVMNKLLLTPLLWGSFIVFGAKSKNKKS